MMRAIIIKNAIAFAIFLCLSACGGGGGGGVTPNGSVGTPSTSVVSSGEATSSSSVANTAFVNGQVIDGYLQGATVYWDCNSNQLLDVEEVSATTLEKGIFSIPKPTGSMCNLIAKISAYTIDEDTGSATGISYQLFPLRSDLLKTAGSINITPLTTLIASGAWETESLGEDALKKYLDVGFSSNTDVIVKQNDSKAIYQANVNRLVARLLESSQSISNNSSVNTPEKALNVLYRATMSAKRLPSQYALNPSEVVNLMLQDGSLTATNSISNIDTVGIEINTIATQSANSASMVKIQKLSGLSNVAKANFARPPLSQLQINYLTNLITDPDVQSVTSSGVVNWHLLPWKKLIVINSELMRLGFYRASDSAVLSIREEKKNKISQLSIETDAAIMDLLGTTPDASNLQRFLDGIVWVSKRRSASDILFLAGSSYNVAEGIIKIAKPPIPFESAVLNIKKWNKAGGRFKLTEKRARFFLAAEKAMAGMSCYVSIKDQFDKMENKEFDEINAIDLSTLLLNTTDCVADLLKANMVKSGVSGGLAANSFTENEMLELVFAATDVVQMYLDLYDTNPLLTKISGGLEIVNAYAQTIKRSFEWAEADGKKVNIDQSAITDLFSRSFDTMLRYYAAQETSLALDGLLVPAGTQVSVFCNFPLMKIANTCVSPSTLPEFGSINIQIIVGEEFPLNISLLKGKMPNNPDLSNEKLQCVKSQVLVSHFEQKCFSNQLGVQDVYVRYFKDSEGSFGITDVATRLFSGIYDDPIYIGKITVVPKPINRVKPMVSGLSVNSVEGSIKSEFFVQDADSSTLRMIVMDISGDAGATYICSQQVSNVQSGWQALSISPTSTTGCKSLLMDTGLKSFRIRVYAIDDTNVISDYLYKDIGYSYNPPKSAPLPVVSSFTVANTGTATVTGSFNVTDPNSVNIKYLRVHVAKAQGGSNCQIDVGTYGSLQQGGNKNFSGSCASLLTATGTYYAKIEAIDANGKHAAVVDTSFIYTASNKAPVVSGFTINNTTSTGVTGSFTITDADNDKVKNLRVHIGKVDGGSDCLIDVGGVYGTEQVAGVKSFSGTCATPLTVAGTYYGKVEAADVKGNSAAIVKTTFAYTKLDLLPVVSGFSVANTTTSTVSGSFNVTDPNGVNIKYLRVHLAKTQGGSECQIDIGTYGSLQAGGNKNFSSSCASLLAASGNYYAKVEAIDGSGNQAAVVNTTFTYTSTFVVSSFSPNVLTQNQLSTITVFGSGVPSTAILTIADANCGSPYGHTANGFYQDCTPIVAGSKSITIKTQPGGSVVYTNTVTVNAAPFSVSSYSPATLKKGVQTTITITGVSVPSTAILAVENANCGSPYGHTSTSFKQDCNAQITGIKMLTVKDKSGGNIVYTNSISVTN